MPHGSAQGQRREHPDVHPLPDTASSVALEAKAIDSCGLESLVFVFPGMKGVPTSGQVPCQPRGHGDEAEPLSPALVSGRRPVVTPEPCGYLPLPSDPQLREGMSLSSQPH